MTKDDQARIIAELCESTKKYMLERLDRVPDDWDGHELRRWYADRALLQCSLGMGPTRTSEYHNTVIVNNL